MNHIYKIVFNKATGTMTAVAEFARGHGKGSLRTKIFRPAVFRLSLLVVALGLAGVAQAEIQTATTLDFTTTAAKPIDVYVNDMRSSVVIGKGSEGDTKKSTVVGDSVKSNGEQATVIGSDAKSFGNQETLLGYKALAYGDNSTAIAANAVANGVGAIAMGNEAQTGDTKLALNKRDEIPDDTKGAKNAIAIGTQSKVKVNNAIGLGANTQAKQVGAVAIGSGSIADRVGLAQGTTANNQANAAQNSVYSPTDTDNTAILATVKGTDNGAVSVGNDTTTRQIINVAAGSADSDAVNVAQLKAVAKQIKPTTTITTAADGKITTPTNGDNPVTANSVATAINGTFWNVADNADAVKGKVNPADTVKFADGNATTATVEAETDKGVTVVKYDVAVDGNTIEVKGGKLTAKAPTIATTTLTSSPTGKVTAPNDKADDFVKAGDIANAINNSGFMLKANSETTGQKIANGDSVDFVNGSNIAITRNGNKITVATKNDVNFNSVTTGNTVMNNNGITIANGANPVSLTNTGLNNGGNKVVNVAQGVADTDAVNVKQLKDSRTTVQSSDNTISVVNTNKGNGDNLAYDIKINSQTVVDNAQRPVVYTDIDGNKVVKHGDKFYKASDIVLGKPKNGATTINPASLIASFNTGSNDTTTPMIVGNVSGNLLPTYNVGDKTETGNGKLGNELAKTATKSAKAPQNIAPIYNNVATVGDVLNAGFNLQENGTAKDFVKAYDTVNFVNGAGTKAVVEADNQGKINKIKYDVNVDDDTIKIDPNGKLTVNKEAVDTNTVTTVTGGNGIKVENISQDSKAPNYKVSVKTDGITTKVDNNGNIVANTTQLTQDPVNAGKVASPKGNESGKLVDAKNIANAINNAGFNLTTANNGNSTNVTELVNPGDEVKINGDKNITVSQVGGTVNIATKNDVNFNSVTTGNTVMNNNGITIANGANPVSLTNTGLNNGGNKVVNVAQGVADTDAVNVKQLKDSRTTVQSSDNTISVVNTNKGNGDNLAYDIKINSQTVVDNAQRPVVYTDIDGNKVVKHGDKFYKASDIVLGKPKNGATTINPASLIASFNTGSNDTTTPMIVGNVSGNLLPTYNVGDKTETGNGKLGNELAKTATKSAKAPQNIAPIYNNVATVGDVLNAGFNLQENGTAKDFVKAYDTVNFVNGAGTKAVVEADNQGKINKIKYDVNVDDDTIKIDPNGKLTVNKEAVDTNTVTTVTGGNGIKVENISQDSKAPNYKVSVKTDGITTKVDNNGNIVANTTQLTQDPVNAGKVASPKGNESGKLVDAKNIANAINNAGFNLTTANNGNSTNVTELVNPGDEVKINGDKNITVSQVGGTVNIATKNDVNFNSVTTGNTVMNNNGITIANGANPVSLTNTGLNNGGNKVVNVADGEISQTSTDAVNGSQLYATNQSIKNIGDNINNLNNRIDGVADDANAGVSSAMAMASLPQAYLPGKSMLTGGLATYNGESAVAVGFSKLSDNGRWVLKISGSADTKGNAGGAIGAGFHF